jgi:ketosteroid isomerase-like protein
MTNRDEPASLRLVRRYFHALEQGADEERVESFFAPHVRQHEFSNRLLEHGAERGLSELLAGYRKGKQVVVGQRFEITNAVVDGDGQRVALEMVWTAQLKVPLGKLAAGDTLRASCGVFFRIEAGKIVEQHNFDCFQPF